jgi:hypothetical protein
MAIELAVKNTIPGSSWRRVLSYKNEGFPSRTGSFPETNSFDSLSLLFRSIPDRVGAASESLTTCASKLDEHLRFDAG